MPIGVDDVEAVGSAVVSSGTRLDRWTSSLLADDNSDNDGYRFLSRGLRSPHLHMR